MKKKADKRERKAGEKTIAERLLELGAIRDLNQEERRAEKQEQVLAYFKENGEFPSSESKDPKLKHLGQSTLNWMKKNHSSYDPTFEPRARALGWKNLEERRAEKQEQVLAYFKENGEFPSSESKDPKLSNLGKAARTWMSENHSSYDPTFEPRARALGWKNLEERRAEKQEEALAYLKENGKFPSQYDKDPKLNRLGRAVFSWLSKSTGSYDPSFESRARALGWKPRNERKS